MSDLNDEVDKILVQAAQDGLECGQHLLYAKHWVLLLGLATRYEYDASKRTEHDGFLFAEVMKDVDKFRWDCKFSTMLYTRANMLMRKELQNRMREPAEMLIHAVNELEQEEQVLLIN